MPVARLDAFTNSAQRALDQGQFFGTAAEIGACFSIRKFWRTTEVHPESGCCRGLRGYIGPLRRILSVFTRKCNTEGPLFSILLRKFETGRTAARGNH